MRKVLVVDDEKLVRRGIMSTFPWEKHGFVVSGEAARTAGYLALGAWGTIVAEAETANVVLAPMGEGALLMVRRDRSIPVGLALRFAERARGAAHQWLERQGA